MEPGALRVAALLAKPTEQWMYVLQGRLNITVGKVTHVLELGNSIYYDGEALHAFASIGDEELRSICCITLPEM